MDCLFCKIAKGSEPSVKVYEDDNTLAFMDLYPVAEGHTLIIPKAHFRNILDITPDEISNVGKAVAKVAVAVKKATNADGITVVQASEKAAKQFVFHLHFHIIPRFDNDGFGLGFTPHETTHEALEGIASKITEEL